MNKTILITGATSGFGRETALLLGQKGCRLILIGRRLERLEKLKKEINGEVYISKVDVSNRKEVEEFFLKLPDEYKKINVLVNNAGLARGLDNVYDANLDDWEEMIRTNVLGLVYVTKYALNSIQKDNGMIINLGSISATVPYKGSNVYGATKAFVKQFSKNLRVDLFGTNIKVANIEPGMAETEFSLVRFKGDSEKAKNVYANTLSLKAEDIANTINWLIEQPSNVNIDNIEIMPIDQTYGGMVVNRRQN